MVTTYWGFYIPADTTIPLVQRLVVDPVYLYTVMMLMVPLGFGFSYMMIHLAKEAERKAKLAKEKGPKKIASIDLSQKWINYLIVALLAFQVFLNIAAYNAAMSGMKNLSLFFIGLIMMAFAGFFHIYRYSMSESKKAPPPPPVISKEESEELVPAIPAKLPETQAVDSTQTIENSQIPTPQVKADLGFDPLNNELGKPDLSKF